MLALETRLTMIHFALRISVSPNQFMRYLKAGPRQILEDALAGTLRVVGAHDSIDRDTIENIDEASKLLQDVMLLIHPNLPNTPISPDSSSVGMGTGNPEPVV